MRRRPFQLNDLYELPVASDPQLSPDGQHIAFVVTTADRDSDERQSAIWLVATGGGPARRLTAGSRDLAPRFSPDGQTLAFLSARPGAPPQLWLMPVAGGAATQLTSMTLGAGPGAWSPDGSAIAFSAIVDTTTADTPASPADARRRPVVVEDFGYKLDGFGLRRGLREHILVQPVHGGQARQVTSGDGDQTGPVWSPDSRRIAFSTPDYRAYGAVLCPQQVGVIEATGGTASLLTPPEAMVTAVDWSPDGQRLLLSGSGRAGLAEPRLWTVPAEGGDLRELLPHYPGHFMPGWEPHVAARFAPDGRTVRFGEWRNARTRLLEVPAAGGSPRELVGGARNVRAASFGADKIAFIAGDSERVAELYVSDGGHERRLTNLLDEALPGVQFTAPRVRSFTAPDGRRIQGYVLRRDDADPPGPLLLDIHGGPYNSWAPALTEHFLHQQVLAGLGWTVLCVDPRGSASYGDEFMQATTGGWGFADEGDLLCAVDELISDGLADPARLAVSGFSYGGYMTAWLTARTDRFAAAVCGMMTCDEVAAQGTDAGTLTSHLVAGGPMWEAFDRLVECSPIRHVAEVVTPTLILQAEDDLRTPMGQAEQWFQALHARGVRVRLVRYPEASHYFVLEGAPSQALDVYQRLVDWVVEHTETGRPIP